MPRMISMDLQECRVLHMKQDGPKGPKVRWLGHAWTIGGSWSHREESRSSWQDMDGDLSFFDGVTCHHWQLLDVAGKDAATCWRTTSFIGPALCLFPSELNGWLFVFCSKYHDWRLSKNASQKMRALRARVTRFFLFRTPRFQTYNIYILYNIYIYTYTQYIYIYTIYIYTIYIYNIYIYI